jgi:glycyl-tRNA synthetase beta chain
LSFRATAAAVSGVFRDRGARMFHRDLLVEIGIEENPHSFIRDALSLFRTLFTGGLEENKISFGAIQEFSTPRRMALYYHDVSGTQSDYREEKRGPSVDKAYLPDGKPSKALLGFLKGNGVGLEDIHIRATGNREYVFLRREIKGRDTASILPHILDSTLRSVSFPKTMRWEESGFLFARPIRWILFLFGADTIDFQIAHVKSANRTYGHRSYTDTYLTIEEPSAYERTLFEHNVVADRNKRKKRLMQQVDELTEKRGLIVPDIAAGLFDVNTDLTEYPNAVLCEFDSGYLSLPQEVLTSEMVEHQHYFPLTDHATGKITHFFIAVSNIEDHRKTIHGYQKVLRARLDDGRFFFMEDKKVSFSDYTRQLRTVTFHEKLGSMHDKIGRIKSICTVLAGMLSVTEETKKEILTTAELCKNDLVSLMVNEFPNLQGIMGYYYAKESGFPETVAGGIREHYLPRFAADSLPEGIHGAVVGIADRLDTILGIFSIGLRPKGSKDPFALRRNVFAIVRIILSLRLNFSMRRLIDETAGLYSSKRLSSEEVEVFFQDRIRSIFTDMNFSYDEIDASLANALDDVYEAYRRVDALHEFRRNPDFEALLVSFKRMWNIVKDETVFSFSEKLLSEDEERELFRYFTEIRESVQQNVKVKNYREVYSILSSLKPYVDKFFDHVLVMDKDTAVRKNRIGLLRTIIGVFSGIIDISKIVSTGESKTG